MSVPFTAQSCSAATVGTRFRPIGAAGLVCRRGTRLTRCALATGIGCRATVIAGFVGYVAVRVARTRGADTAGVGRGTSVVTGNRRRTAIRVVFTGGTLRTTVVRCTAIGTRLVGNVTVGVSVAGNAAVTGVVFGTAICTVFRGDGTFGAKSTRVVFSVAYFSAEFIFAVTVGRIIPEFVFTNAGIVLPVTGTAGKLIVSRAVRRIVFEFLRARA